MGCRIAEGGSFLADSHADIPRSGTRAKRPVTRQAAAPDARSRDHEVVEYRTWSPLGDDGQLQETSRFRRTRRAAPEASALPRPELPGKAEQSGTAAARRATGCLAIGEGERVAGGAGTSPTASDDRPTSTGRIRTPEGYRDAGRTVQCDRPSTAEPESTACPGPGYLRSDRHGDANRGYLQGGYVRVVAVYVRVMRGRHENDGGTQPHETWLKASTASPARGRPLPIGSEREVRSEPRIQAVGSRRSRLLLYGVGRAVRGCTGRGAVR